MSTLKRELLIWADFNSIDAQRRITASLRFSDAPARPSPGEWVRLHDDEGNAVMGVVEEIHDLIVHVRPEMATWTSAAISIDPPLARNTPFYAEHQGSGPSPSRLSPNR
jgi:hypothetical protein